jgi:hypothetical protein
LITLIILNSEHHSFFGVNYLSPAQTIFKNSAGVGAEMLIDRQVCIPHSQKLLQMNSTPKQQSATVAGTTVMANIYSSQFPLLWGPALIQANFKGKVINCGPTELVIP